MSFGDFLQSLSKDEGPHPYLTTQYSDEEPDVETVFPPPTNALKDEFPIVPRIMGNLFLQQVNLWVGKSKNGSSSGLVSGSLSLGPMEPGTDSSTPPSTTTSTTTSTASYRGVSALYSSHHPR